MKMEASIFFDSYLPHAMRQAVEYAGQDGFVASLPQLLNARINTPYENIIWNTHFNPNSEENLLTTPQGNRVVLTVHGGGIFGSPDRYEKLFRASTDRDSEYGFTGLFAAQITQQEAHDLLGGKTPDGASIPVYSFDEFKRGINDLPRRYAIVTDFDTAKKSECGYVSFDALRDDPMVI
ncbi:uncharacterized protein METZ01_LOCUS314893, partial [marine metagenome]